MQRRTQKPPIVYARRPRQKRKNDILNTFSGLLLLLSFCLLTWFFYIYNFPNSIVNPLRPKDPAALATEDIVLPSPVLPANTPTSQGTETATPIGASALLASVTPLPATATLLPSVTVTQPLTLQTGTAAANTSFSYAVIGISPVNAIPAVQLNPTRDCNWMGVGGYVYNIQNSPATGIMVKLGGKLNNKEMAIAAVSGMASQYGPAGYEFTLAGKPAASTHSLWLQLVDQAQQPISDQVYFDTFDDCQHNLILINFKQIK